MPRTVKVQCKREHLTVALKARRACFARPSSQANCASARSRERQAHSTGARASPANVLKRSRNAQRAPDVRAVAATAPQRAVATKLLRKWFPKRASGAKVEQGGMRAAAHAEIQWTLRSANHDLQARGAA